MSSSGACFKAPFFGGDQLCETWEARRTVGRCSDAVLSKAVPLKQFVLGVRRLEKGIFRECHNGKQKDSLGGKDMGFSNKNRCLNNYKKIKFFAKLPHLLRTGAPSDPKRPH